MELHLQEATWNWGSEEILGWAGDEFVFAPS